MFKTEFDIKSTSDNRNDEIKKKNLHLEEILTDEQRKTIKETFELFDYEGFGKMKVKDLKIAMRSLGFEPKREVIKQMLVDMNINKSEFLSHEEFVSIIASKFAENDTMNEIKRAFEMFDDDKTGFITMENLRKVVKKLGEKFQDEDLLEMIEETDKDGDGAISLQEFAFVMKKTNLY